MKNLVCMWPPQASGQLSGSASTIDEVSSTARRFCFKAVAALDDSHGGDGVLVGKDVQCLQELKGQAVAVNEGSTSQFWLSYPAEKERHENERHHRAEHDRGRCRHRVHRRARARRPQPGNHTCRWSATNSRAR